LCAHKFFSSARLSKVGQGLCSVHQPYVGLSTPTLDGFCDGHKDFLQLYRLLSTFSTVDHVKNAQSCVNRVNTLRGTYGGTYENRISFSTGLQDPKPLILIWDTGTSYGLTPFRSDFIDYVKCEIPVRDVTTVNTVVGIGTTLHKFTDINGNPVYLPCVSYHLPKTDVRLFSPQTYHQMHGGYSEVHSNCIRMLLKTSTIEIQIVREEHNLPVVFDSFVSGKAKKALASNMRSGLCHTRLNALDFFHDNDLGNLGQSP
jgi:hypothetical protein